MKRTKMLVTYGPAIANKQLIKRLVDSGVNAFRVNCSHGTTANFIAAARTIRAGSKGADYPIGLLFDISGPKLRLDRFDDEVQVEIGDEIAISTGKTDLARRIIAVNHPAIIESVRKGERVFVDDGQIEFEAVKTGRTEIVLRARNAGVLLGGKGINLPDSVIKIPTIGRKDREDIATAVKVGADYVALSFVRSGDDLIEARKLIKQAGGSQKLIAKLEKREAIANIEELMLLCDGVMIARGDLGVELPPAELPTLQKRIINLANTHQKPVIVATQMLESMRFAPRATRAEINDVASAVFDFADAVMLSAETATGKYPCEAVATMREIICATEASLPRPQVSLERHLIPSEIPYGIAESVSRLNDYCPTEAIFAFTTTGFTAQMISNVFPPQPIFALTPNRVVVGQLTLYRAVYPVLIRQPGSFTAMLGTVGRIAKRLGLARKGQRAIITGGAPFGSTTATNFMMIHEVK